MYDWQNFDVVFQSKLDCSYDEKTVNAILKNRKELAGTLFFDRVWLNLGLKDGKGLGTVYRQSIVAKAFFSPGAFQCCGLTRSLTFLSQGIIPSKNQS
jgi:hypothetical protein